MRRCIVCRKPKSNPNEETCGEQSCITNNRNAAKWAKKAVKRILSHWPKGWFGVTMGVLLLVFVLLAISQAFAGEPKVMFRVKSVNPDTRDVVLEPIYIVDINAHVDVGPVVEGDVLKCKLKKEPVAVESPDPSFPHPIKLVFECGDGKRIVFRGNAFKSQEY